MRSNRATALRRPSAAAGMLAAVLAGHLACGPRDDPDLAFHRGINALDERRFEAARDHFAEDLERHPERAESRRLAGRAWSSGSYQSASRAVEHWRRYLELRPGDPEVTRSLVRALLLLGEWQQAETWSERLDDAPRARELRARIWLETDPGRAAEELEAALAAGGDDARLHALAADARRRLGEAERAREHARRAVDLDPLDPRATYLAARLEQQAGIHDAAAGLLAVHGLLTRLTGTAGAPEPSPLEALRLVRELEPLVGDAPALRREKLRLLVETGAHGEARETFATVVGPALDGGTPTARLELAGVADKLGDLDAARELLESVLRQERADEARADRESQDREAIYGLALLARRRGDPERARQRLEEGLALFPWVARFHHLLGRLELEAGRADIAAGSFTRALELAPWKTDCRLDLAGVLLADGRRDDVAALLAAAPAGDPAIERYRRLHGLD